jgi:hypothetical protein
MASQACSNEELVLSVLRSSGSLTIEQMIAKLPDLNWNQVFLAVDALSRRGAIVLRRRGYEYELHCPTSLNAAALCSS